MAANGGIKRANPLNPGFRGARNWAAAQIRATGYSKKSLWRFWIWIVFIAITIVFCALWLGGFLPNAQKVMNEFARERLAAIGFVVEHIDVTGEGRLRETDVRRALGVAVGDHMFETDLKSAQKRIESIGWVDHAVVRRLWPNRIVVQIVEREPYALWQNGGLIKLVDAEGRVMADVTDFGEYRDYTLVVGETAAPDYAGMYAIVAKHPALISRMDVAVQYPSGRWDILIDGRKLRIKLPQTSPDSALNELMRLQVQTRILDRNIAEIDLRLPDRVTILPAKSALRQPPV
ncbi:MAG: FtsQ-type POTRA domain-containing protein [Hyphomonadaceae bacterium]|nr:FtsQ-type POTRA domain-containing protein [Hyphomonadaceae bacterium]